MSGIAKFGTPEWKSISETRHAQLVKIVTIEVDSASMTSLKYGWYCGGCNYPKHLGSDFKWESSYKEARAAQAAHDATHDTNMASCCMHSGDAVCKCGNELV